MLTAVADWSTEAITSDFRNGVQILTVSGTFWNCEPDALCRILATNIGISRDDIFPTPDLLVIIAPMGTFLEPANYRTWIDEGVSDAERDTVARDQVAPQAARIAADNIASLAAAAGLSPDAIMRAAMVYPGTADAILRGESLPTADLIRIATALGVSAESLLLPLHGGRENRHG